MPREVNRKSQEFFPVDGGKNMGPYPPSLTYTVKILKIGTPEIITLIVLPLEQLDFTVQYCAQKMQTE